MFNKLGQIVEMRVLLLDVDKKVYSFSVEGICNLSNSVFEAMRCCYHYCPCQEARPSFSVADIESGLKNDGGRRDAQTIRSTKRVSNSRIVGVRKVEFVQS